MKVVLTCGHPYSGLQQLHQAMLGAGLKPAKVSRREMLSPENIQSKICEAIEVDSSLTLNPDRLKPGKVWQWLSTDLFIANLDQEAWGWADPNTLYLLNYWRDFDSQTRFVLVYASPSYALAQLLREKEASPVLVEGLCSSWAKVNAELLSFYNRNPDRSILVNVEALLLPEEANRLVSVSRDRLGINLSTQADWCIDLPPDDAVFRLFASSLLQEYPAVQELYQELESVADIICDFSEPPKEQVAQAFVQYRNLASRHDEALALSTQLNAQVTELQSQLVQVQQELASEKQKPDLSSQLTELGKENKFLLLQLHNVQEELEHYFLQQGESLALSTQLNAQVTELQSQLVQVQRELASEKQKPDLSSQLATLEKENELLLLQLHQVQEELEHYFLKYMEITQGQSQPVEQIVGDASVDLRQAFQGQNWYDAEVDGRWAGPEKFSILTLPKVKPGRYQIELEVVDAMTPEILKGTKFSLNGAHLTFVDTKPLPLLSRLIGKKKKYPITLTACADIGLDQCNAGLDLEFQFPSVISPASRGSQDMRYLALRLKTVKLKPLA